MFKNNSPEDFTDGDYFLVIRILIEERYKRIIPTFFFCFLFQLISIEQFAFQLYIVFLMTIF